MSLVDCAELAKETVTQITNGKVTLLLQTVNTQARHFDDSPKRIFPAFVAHCLSLLQGWPAKVSEANYAIFVGRRKKSVDLIYVVWNLLSLAARHFDLDERNEDTEFPRHANPVVYGICLRLALNSRPHLNEAPVLFHEHLGPELLASRRQHFSGLTNTMHTNANNLACCQR